MKYLLILSLLICKCAFSQMISPSSSQKSDHTDSSHTANSITTIKNIRIVQFGLETGTQFIYDSVQSSHLGNKNLIHYGLNLQIGDMETPTVFTLIGCDFYVSNGYKKNEDTSQIKNIIWGITGNLGVRIPISLSKSTTINFGPSLLLGRHGVANSNVNAYGIRLATTFEKRLGVFPCIAYMGVAYDNTAIYKRYKGFDKRNLDQLRIYFGIRF